MSDNYATPKWLMGLFEDWFDPCPLNPNPQFDGLSIEWKDKTFVNPPYSKPEVWVDKAIESARGGKRIVMLLRVDTSTKWFRKLVDAKAHFCWIGERLHFSDKPANFASMLVILND